MTRTVKMPTCSKCRQETVGYPRSWGPSCTWIGEPVIPREVEEYGGKESETEQNVDKFNGGKASSDPGNSSSLHMATGNHTRGRSPRVR